MSPVFLGLVATGLSIETLAFAAVALALSGSFGFELSVYSSTSRLVCTVVSVAAAVSVAVSFKESP